MSAVARAEADRLEVLRLRQILWDIYAVSGADTDGEKVAPPPGVMTPDVPELALGAVRELREEEREASEWAQHYHDSL